MCTWEFYYSILCVLCMCECVCVKREHLRRAQLLLQFSIKNYYYYVFTVGFVCAAGRSQHVCVCLLKFARRLDGNRKRKKNTKTYYRSCRVDARIVCMHICVARRNYGDEKKNFKIVILTHAECKAARQICFTKDLTLDSFKFISPHYSKTLTGFS